MKNSTLLKKSRQKTIFAEKEFQVGVIAPVYNQKNIDSLLLSIESLCQLGFNFQILLDGDEEYQKKCYDLSQTYNENIKVLEKIPKNKTLILNNIDVILFPSELDDKLLTSSIKKGVIPIIPNRIVGEQFTNFNAQTETGNAFLFNDENPAELFAILVRAYENFKFSYDWNNLKKVLKKTIL